MMRVNFLILTGTVLVQSLKDSAVEAPAFQVWTSRMLDELQRGRLTTMRGGSRLEVEWRSWLRAHISCAIGRSLHVALSLRFPAHSESVSRLHKGGRHAMVQSTSLRRTG